MSKNPKWWRLWIRAALSDDPKVTKASERRLRWQWRYAEKQGRWMANTFYCTEASSNFTHV